jgi:hypothetical protein
MITVTFLNESHIKWEVNRSSVNLPLFIWRLRRERTGNQTIFAEY